MEQMEQMKDRINLNRASAEELEQLPGIGPALAQAIVARREEAGPFRRIEDLTSVRGIGPVLVGKLESLVGTDEPEGAMAWAANPSLAEEAEPAGDEADEHNNEVSKKETIPMDHLLRGTDELERGVNQSSSTEDEQRPGEEEAEEHKEEGESAATEPQSIHKDETAGPAELMEEPEEAWIKTLAAEAREEVDKEESPAELETGAYEQVEETTLEPKQDLPSMPAAPVATSPPPAGKQEEPLPGRQPARHVIEKRGVSFWQGLLMVLLGSLLGAAVAVGVFWLINGTLDVSRHWQVRNLHVQILQLRAERDSLTAHMDILSKELQAVRSDLTALPQMKMDIGVLGENLAGLSTELAALERDLSSIRSDVETVTANVGALETQVSDIDKTLKAAVGELERISLQMDEVAEKAERFDAFLLGLRALLQETAPATP